MSTKNRIPKTTPQPPPADLDPEEFTPERAFRRSGDGYTLGGQTLEPWSFVRQAAAESLGLLYGAVPEHKQHTFTVPDGHGGKVGAVYYDGMLYDIALVLWLCSQPIETVKAARRNPEAFEDDITEWADEHGILKNDPRFAEAFGTFMQIMADRAVSTAQPKADATPGDASPKI